MRHLGRLAVDVVGIAELRHPEGHHRADAAVAQSQHRGQLRLPVLPNGRQHEPHVYLAHTQRLGHQRSVFISQVPVLRTEPAFPGRGYLFGIVQYGTVLLDPDGCAKKPASYPRFIDPQLGIAVWRGVFGPRRI